MGYELTAADLQEMLHGEKVTSSEKSLTWKKDGKETTIRGRLVLTEQYKVRIAPKLRSKQTTVESCPKCMTGTLQLVTAVDGSKWYGCNAFPQCRFTKAFIPHSFNPGPQKADAPVSHDSGFETPAVTANRLRTKEHPNANAQKATTQNVVISRAASKTEPTDHERYQRIPKFILRMLKRDKSSSNSKA